MLFDAIQGSHFLNSAGRQSNNVASHIKERTRLVEQNPVTTDERYVSLYDQEDDDMTGQTEPDIKDPFEFQFDRIPVTKLLRPPTVLHDSS